MIRARAEAMNEAQASDLSPEEFWWLLQEVAVACRRTSDRQLAAAGTSSDQVQALRLLSAGELTVGELSRQLGLERNSGSQLVERLFKRGFVDRIRSHDDRRRVMIKIDPAGQQLLRQAEPIVDSVAGSVLAGLSEADLTLAGRILTVLRDGGSPMPHDNAVPAGD